MNYLTSGNDAVDRIGMMNLTGNIIPVTLGNIVGGCMIGVILWYCNIKKKG